MFGRMGRGLAEASGFRVTNSPANLFQLLCLSILLRGGRDYRPAVQAVRALRDHGWDSAARMAGSSVDARREVLQQAGIPAARARAAAATLGELARSILERYRGDLRRLRTRAGQRSDAERKLLRELPGVDDKVVDLFFREAQGPWREIAPFADQPVLSTARKLGLGRSPDDLSAIVGGPESEKIAWLVGALARVDLDKRYGEMRELAHA